MICTTCLALCGFRKATFRLPERFFARRMIALRFVLAVNIKRNGAPSAEVNCMPWWARRPKQCGKQESSKATGWWGTCPIFPRRLWRCWRPAPLAQFGVRAHQILACAVCWTDSNGWTPSCWCAAMGMPMAASGSTVGCARPKSWAPWKSR